MTARKSLLLGTTLLALTVSAAAAAGPAKPTPNDGLPKQWFGVTVGKWSASADSVSTYSSVTFTLSTKKVYKRSAVPPTARGYYLGATGTMYEYVPSGTFEVSGMCGHPFTEELDSRDGNLAIEVEKGVKTPRAAYFGGGSGRPVKLPYVCPDTGNPPPSIEPLNFGFKTTPDYNPILRRLTTTTTKFVGSFVDQPTKTQGIDNSYEWCFVRARKDLILCSHLIP